jgi:hypothetical protein
VNDAAELKLRAERRLGEILATAEKNPGGLPLSSQRAMYAARLATLRKSERFKRVPKHPFEFEGYVEPPQGA